MHPILDAYVDYLICSSSHTTATGMAEVTNNAISHDKMTKFLLSRDFGSADLWEVAKPIYKSIEDEDGVLILDDSISEKPYTDENELISWHHDHKENRAVKGINFISAMYSSKHGAAPVEYDLVRKTEEYIDKKTGKKKRKSPVSKQQMFRNLIMQAIKNGIKFKHLLADSWYASSQNMGFLQEKMIKFIMPVRFNRRVALSEADKAAGNFVGIDSLTLGENAIVWLQGLDFPLRFVVQHFKNEDGSTGVLYLVCNDMELTDEQIKTIYKKRWKIETYHKSLKSNTSLNSAPAKIPRTQANHLFASLCAYIRLECFAFNQQINKKCLTNHFAIKRVIYVKSIKRAMVAWSDMRMEGLLTNGNSTPPAA